MNEDNSFNEAISSTEVVRGYSVNDDAHVVLNVDRPSPTVDISATTVSKALNPNPERITNTKVIEQNAANFNAGLPPISLDGVSPLLIPESTLSPIYPRMTELVDAVKHDRPIPVDDSVVEIERPSSYDPLGLRRFMDTVAEEDALTGDPIPVPYEPREEVQKMRDTLDAYNASQDEPVNEQTDTGYKIDAASITTGTLVAGWSPRDEIASLRCLVYMQTAVMLGLLGVEIARLLLG